MRPVQVVKQWFTSRTIDELHRYLHTDDKHDAKHDEYSSFSKRESPKVSLMICSAQTVQLVNHCFPTRTSRTSRKPLFHETFAGVSEITGLEVSCQRFLNVFFFSDNLLIKYQSSSWFMFLIFFFCFHLTDSSEHLVQHNGK